jgi:ABC-type multidrug transport system fused ATPase/permease subunit
VRVFDVIDREPEIIDRPDCKNDYTLKEAIRFEGVTFKYPTAPDHVRNVLQNSSFNIKVGSSTAIVGPSGSGKSTIVQMIERFYNPSEGEIYFDNVNITDITLKGLRESIGYVSQEPVLILGTIKDNILFGNVDATEAEIHEALSKANATFVFEMENGLETYIGSASVLNLSGGQK